MIRTIEIEGFKSIDRLELPLGRVTVLIGENGCGKSNILEAIAFASAAYADRLDHEFLASRGIRNVEPRLMRPAFEGGYEREDMRVVLHPLEGRTLGFRFKEAMTSLIPGWKSEPIVDEHDSEAPPLALEGVSIADISVADVSAVDADRLPSSEAVRYWFMGTDYLRGFLIFSPENSALRVFQREGQIVPIGINGEGLFAYLRALDRAGKVEVLDDLNQRLGLIDWFLGFEVPGDLGPGERRLSIRDRYLSREASLDQRSANEGFLFLLFYYTLLLSPDTPKFFAIDNIDASLNPRLCARLMKDVVELAKQHDRQVVVTTHNPAVLDGLDLTDDEQRLVVVSRSPNGPTRVRRVRAPEPIEGEPPLRLSEAFIRGFLGGLPGNF